MRTDNFPELDIEDFNYDLPKERISLFPEKNRNESKLIISNPLTKTISHKKFSDIVDIIQGDSLLVLNNTKVIAARIPSQKETGGKAEILCTNPILPSYDPQITMQACGKCSWQAILGGRAIRVGSILFPNLTDESIKIQAEVISKNGMEGEVEFNWQPKNMSFAEVLENIGKVPLPPYIDRENVESDKERYQTVYAENDGSVAAPTAGLHFTDEILDELKKKGVDRCSLTLHVGPGTFRPVSESDISNHDMHKEQIIVPIEQIEKLIDAYQKEKNVIAVGTTSLRTLESMYRIGVNLFNDENRNIKKEDDGSIFFELEQWEAYNQKTPLPTPLKSLTYLRDTMLQNNIDTLIAYTQLFIVPGYEIKTINGIITNFHMPKSTLIMLVASFCGGDFWREIYSQAMENDYRFLSYGDSSYISKVLNIRYN